MLNVLNMLSEKYRDMKEGIFSDRSFQFSSVAIMPYKILLSENELRPLQIIYPILLVKSVPLTSLANKIDSSNQFKIQHSIIIIK